MRRSKVTVIGAGNVGATAAHWAAIEGLGDVVLLDVLEGIPQGKALDQSQFRPITGISCSIIGTNDYKDTADSDVIIITSGIARKPGMSRDDLLATNVKIVKEVTEKALEYSKDAYLVVVTNPIDAMVYTSYKVSGLPKNKVIGMAGVLDSARYRSFLADAIGVSPKDVNAIVMGIHGDYMLPLVRLANVCGIPITELLPKDEIDAIVKRTQNGGAEIVAHLKTGSAYYTPAAAAVEMAKAIIFDEKRVLPCAAYLEGEFGISGYFLGVPVVIGKNGVEKILQFKLTEEEQSLLKLSVEKVKEQVASVNKILGW
ncbi:MAG: malate dehydrogenase [Desulfurella sp.]|uniref:malate dehydrogenase n=1 Tax=Desulfurella sp. TaxID=1962857 RepID=UPI003D12E0E8